MTINKRIRDAALQTKDLFGSSHPEWQYPTDSPLKYVDWALEDTIEKSWYLAATILRNATVPFPTVFECGPGTGYLLAILQELGCAVSGCDIPDCPLYRYVHGLLGINTVAYEKIRPSNIIRNCPAPAPDVIVATQISFMDDWNLQALEFFIRQFNLRPGGSIYLFPNPKACRGMFWDTAFWSAVNQDHYRTTQFELPLLGKGIQIYAPVL